MTVPKTKTLLFTAAGIAFLAAIFAFKIQGGMADFEVNYRAGHRLRLGETLYRTADSHWQFKYSPFSAMIYLPLSALPLPAAKAAWFLLVGIAVAAVIVLGRKLAISAGMEKPGPAVVLAALILAKFFLREIQLGQINALIAALLMGMALLLVRDDEAPLSPRRTGAGILWGLATALKPYALIFLPYLVLKRKWRALAWGGAVLAAALAVPSLFYGIRGNAAVLGEWISSLSRSTPGLLVSQDNVSLLAFLMKWMHGSPAATLIYGAGVALLAVLTLLFLRGGRDLPRAAVAESALLLVFIPLISPLGWDYTFLSAFAAVVLVTNRMSVFPKAVRFLLAANFLVIALALYDVLGRRLYAAFMARSVPTLDFLLVVGALFYLRAKKAV
jgi:alpha-1,2-mannosyltransferase